MTARTACAIITLLLGSVGHAGDASLQVPDDLGRIEAGLIGRAGRLLERYGTTFYALAAYVDATGKTHEVVATRSAPLQPEAIGSALREALAEIPRSRVLAAGLMVDLPEEQKVRIQLETVSGDCYQLARPYSFEKDGQVVFHKASTERCASRLYPDN
jgi:hypothetical protein